MATKTTNEQVITIPALDIRTATVKIVGDSPLIMHKWSEKAKKEILDKQMKKRRAKATTRKTRSPTSFPLCTGSTVSRKTRPRRALPQRWRMERGSASRQRRSRPRRSLRRTAPELQRTWFP